MDKEYREMFTRNIGIFTETEQDKLQLSSIAIAGMGGVGGLLAERLIRMGVGRIKILDPGVFEKSNFNRQFGASMTTLGQNKAETIYNQIKDINQQAEIEYSKTGLISETDAIQFISDSNLVIDEMDFGLYKQSISLQRAARKKGIYYFFTTAIGFGAMIVIFSPQGYTLEEYDNLPKNVNLDQLEKIQVPVERIMSFIPSYAPPSAYDILRKVYNGETKGPVTSIGVGLASIMAANEAVNIILKKREIPVAPKYIYIDLLDLKVVTGTISK